MSDQPASNKTNMTEAQIKQLIKNLANTFGHPIRSPILRTPDEYGLEYKNLSFPSMDGVPLEAWFMPAESDKLVIANHPLWFNRYGFPAHLGSAATASSSPATSSAPCNTSKRAWISGTCQWACLAAAAAATRR
jgi:hypothetical protein